MAVNSARRIARGTQRGKRVGVLIGGLSSEREISERSGRAVAAALVGLGYDVVSIPVARDVADRLAAAGVEVAFNALHGRFGEDGCIQGLLETMALPYTGAGVLGSALAMDKWLSKLVLQAAGVQTPAGILVTAGDRLRAREFALPAVVKPRGEGSTNGVSLVRDPALLDAAIDLALRFDDDALVEEFVPGHEVTVAILEDRALGAMEVIPIGEEFHTYAVKYTPGREEFVLPAPLGDAYQPTLDVALRAHRALLAGPYGRVDLRVRGDGKAFVLEANTLPGLHELGWFPAIARHSGIEFADLIERILDLAALGVPETTLTGGVAASPRGRAAAAGCGGAGPAGPKRGGSDRGGRQSA